MHKKGDNFRRDLKLLSEHSSKHWKTKPLKIVKVYSHCDREKKTQQMLEFKHVSIEIDKETGIHYHPVIWRL